MYVKYGVPRNVAKWQDYLKSLPRGMVRVGLDALTQYLIGRPGQALRRYEGYKHVTRKRAYGQTFQSDKQRKWFWANGGPDMIGNNRTGATANSWTSKQTHGGYGVSLENRAPGAAHIWGDNTQAAQPAMVGHRTVSEKISTNIKGAIRFARAAVNKYLKSR